MKLHQLATLCIFFLITLLFVDRSYRRQAELIKGLHHRLDYVCPPDNSGHWRYEP